MFASEENEHEDVSGIESALRSLKPTAAGLNRDQLLYLAGQASLTPVRPTLITRWRWAIATAASIMLAVLLGRLTAPEKVNVVDRVVQVPVHVQSERPVDELRPQNPAVGELDRDGTPTVVERSRRIESLPVDRTVVRPYVRLRDQVVALGPDMLPALGSSGQSATTSSDSYLEMRQRLIQ